MWVDGGDPAWQRRKAAYQESGTDARLIRYRDWKLLRYWFRAVEQFAPWVRTVYLVTDQQCPQWLNCDCPKLKLVDHRDFIPPQYLPTFSANPIELNLHRLPGLSEHFVFFNDDMFLLKPVTPQDFFQNGLPVDDAVLSPIILTTLHDIGSIVANDMCIINTHFDKAQSIRKAPGKWFALRYGKALLRSLCLMPWRHFPGFFNDHLPQPFLKESYEAVWAAEPDILDETCHHRFRDYKRDVNQWLIRYWQLASNRFVPASPKRGRAYDISDASALEAIRTQRWQMICINDTEKVDPFEPLQQLIEEAFFQILPHSSLFEKAP